MSEKIVQFNEEIIKELVCGSVTETLNELLKQAAEKLTKPLVTCLCGGIYLRQNWNGEYENIAGMVAIAVNEGGFRLLKKSK